jgi:uncharacterized membrane protein
MQASQSSAVEATQHTNTQHTNTIVRKISLADLKDALRLGLADFKAMPTHLPFLCVIYGVITFVAIRYYGNLDVLPLVLPAFAGFTLIGPLVAIGMYELSRRRESGEDVSRTAVFDVIHSPQIVSIAGLTIILLVFYTGWMAAAWGIYGEITGGAPLDSVDAFLTLVFTTAKGQKFLLIGSAMGLVFSIVVLGISATSFPMLIDRKVGIWTAIQTSMDVVFINPLTMMVWGLIVSFSLLIGASIFLVGLGVVLPVLGHATWHLYRKAVV